MALEIECAIGRDAWDLLHVLTHRVRVLTSPQICRTWNTLSVTRIKHLEEAGLVVLFPAVVHPERPVTVPVIQWSGGEAPPDFASASYQLRSRWKESAVTVRCVIASRAAGRMFGGHGGRFPRESEETHDIHLAAVYLKYRAEQPALAAFWLHEEEIRKSRDTRIGKLPDAIISGHRKVIECGGSSYKAEKLEAFHKYCEAKGFDYEVW